MYADPEYLRSWRDLLRRELLFWFFVLSYVPGFFRHSVHERSHCLCAACAEPSGYWRRRPLRALQAATRLPRLPAAIGTPARS
jgi:hypothetical protein